MVTRGAAGKLPDWVVFVVATACLVTFATVTVGVDLALHQVDHAKDTGWLPLGLTFLVAFWIFASWLPPARLSRALRVAVLLPGAHAAVITLAWPAWDAVSRHISNRATASAIVTEFPIITVVACTLVGFVAFACGITRRRSGEWLHAVVMLALAELLLVGLWLPFAAAAIALDAEWYSWTDPVVRDVPSAVAWVVVPPTIGALLFTTAALRRPWLVLQLRWFVIALVAVALAFAVLVRLEASEHELLVYSNVVPILLAATAVAVSALVLFGAALALRARRLRRSAARGARIEGTIVSDDLVPAFGYEITSWLRGPRVVQRPFAVATRDGTMPISGAHLVAALPPFSSQLRVGECIAVLRPGDRILVTGRDASRGDPFRTSASPIASDVYVAPAHEHVGLLAHVALAMWRPCVAYLWIAVAVAIPALAALAAT